MHHLSPSRLRIAAALITAFVAQTHASDHIYIDVAPNDNLGAGFGELSPGFHDLRVTVNASGGDVFWIDGWDSSG